MRTRSLAAWTAVVLFNVPAAGLARPAGPVPVNAPAPGGPAEGAKPDGKLVLLFNNGQASLTPQNLAILDKAARIYVEAKPIIMIVSGATDSTGGSVQNLLLSNRRAIAVAQGLVARGIPAERTQILAKGETNPAVPAAAGVAQPENRRVEITWSAGKGS